MTGDARLTINDIVTTVEGLPRWRTAPTPDRGPVTLLVDHGHRTGLVLLRSSATGWYATYHDNHHTYRRQRLAETNPFYDDGIYAEMAQMGVPDPVSLPIPPDDAASVFRRIEAMRDEQLLADSSLRRFTDRLAEALRLCLTAPGDPWESTGSLDAPAGGYVQWTRMDKIGTPVHIEVSDGTEYAQPLDPRLVRLLVDLGWQAPDTEFRNAWTRALRPDEIDGAAAQVATTMVVALGAETWHLTWDQRAG